MKEIEKWEDLLQKMEQKSKRSKLWLIAVIVPPVVLIAIFLYQNQQEKVEVAQQIIEVENIRESILDSARIREILTEQVKQRTLHYMKTLSKKKSDSLQMFYADTLDAYYINIIKGSKKEVKAAEDFWFKKTPRELVTLDSVDIVSTNNRHTAYISIQHSKDSTKNKPIPMFMVIKFDANNKIDFVKSYKNEVRRQ